jgi:ectoine hydroxylase-related dioxygenase (phytanoyl-CoA dioxygenase family)
VLDPFLKLRPRHVHTGRKHGSIGAVAAYHRDAGVRPADETTRSVGDEGALRARMAEDGYLVLRHVVPVDVVAGLSRALAEVLAGAGLVPAGYDPMAGEPLTDGAAGTDVHADRELFKQLYRQEALHRLPHQPGLLELAGALLDGEVLVHPHPALRVVFPATEGPLGATPAHQDHLGMQGTTHAFTIWVALSPCPVEAGVLTVARGSHRGGLRRYHPVAGARVACCDASDLAQDWVASDLQPGDVIAFHSLTVHRALTNRSGALRMSVDARYQRATDPVCRSTLRELPDLPWDELYAGWSEAAPRRYWEEVPLQIVEFNPSLLA